MTVPRSCIVLDRIPDPPVGGQALRYRQALDALGALGEVRLLCLSRRPEHSRHYAVKWLRPEPADSPWRHAAALLGPAVKRRFRDARRSRHLDRLRFDTGDAIAAMGCDLVLVASAELATYLPPPQTLAVPVIYDAHNVEKVLWGDLGALRASLLGPAAKTRFRDRILTGEAALMGGAQQVWACSNADADLLRATYPESSAEIRVVPNAIDTSRFADLRRTVPTHAGPPILLLTGDFGYLPNLEAGLMLIGEILPLVRRAAPGCRLVLCGRHPPPAMRAAAAGDPAIIITGEVADVRPWLATCDVVVVPLRHGGGTRIKILEALAAGCPVVSTVKGAEGLEVDPDHHLLLADTAAAMAEAIVRCLREPVAAAAMGVRGQVLVEARYSWRANREVVHAAVGALLAAPRQIASATPTAPVPAP